MIRNLLIVAIIGVGLALSPSCKKEDTTIKPTTTGGVNASDTTGTLEFTVINANNDALVEGAQVALFKDQYDYTQNINALNIGITGANGVSTIKNLAPLKYYFRITKSGLTNNATVNRFNGEIPIKTTTKVSVKIK
ncbi:MAG: hypothetical protein SGJ04_10130 [Bacteroidota bacterium]|nr:hypothetical protein [Bacteroidota bacterium]